MLITRSVADPIRQNLSWQERWSDRDQGLIACWERGREKSKEDPTLAAQARDGWLVVLPWKGGKVNKNGEVTNKRKYGPLYYLAMWQGLRGDDLSIALEEKMVLTCTRSKMTVVFTNDPKKYAEA